MLNNLSPSNYPNRYTPSEAATLIQRHYRSHLTRQNLQKQHAAALTIQRHIRGFLARHHLTTRKPHLIALHYTSKRLRATRERITAWEKEMKSIRNVRAQKVNEWEQHRAQKSSVTVQRWWRRQLQEKREAEEKERREREDMDQPVKPLKAPTVTPYTPSAAELEVIYSRILDRLAVSIKERKRVDTNAVFEKLHQAQQLLDILYDRQRENDAAVGCAALRHECDGYLTYLRGDPKTTAPPPFNRVSKTRARLEHDASLAAAKQNWWNGMDFTSADDERWDFSAEPETGSYYWL